MSLAIPWTSAQFGGEFSLGGTYTSAQAETAAKLGTPFTSAQLAAANAYTPPTATTDTPAISGSYFETGTGRRTVTTNDSVTAVVSNGQAPFTYAWSFVTTGPIAVSIDAPNGATTTCSANLGPNQEALATIQCKVTDALNNTCLTGGVSVDLSLGNNL